MIVLSTVVIRIITRLVSTLIRVTVVWIIWTERLWLEERLCCCPSSFRDCCLSPLLPYREDVSRLLSDLWDVGFLKLTRRSSEGDRDLFLDSLLLWLDSDEPPSLLLLESGPSIVRNEFGETLLSSSSTWWSIRVSASQLSVKLSETVNARGPSLEEFPAKPEVVASVVDCRLGSVATVGRLTAKGVS